jgi:signal transduction histidine kinase/ligand-binding sensor domain-containing protein
VPVKNFYIAGLLLLLFTKGIAQNTSPLVLTHITEENGLSDNRVNAIFKDREGLLWIGTGDGLNLMNGSSIKIFRHVDNDSNSISGNYITSLTEDKAGNIFFGTGNGLCWYDKKLKLFKSLYLPSSSYGISGIITGITWDDNDQLWCATDGGLYTINLSTKKITPFYNPSTEEGTSVKYSNELKQLTQTPGSLWLASEDGLWRFDMQTRIYKKIIHKNNSHYHPLCLTVYADHENRIWAGFWNVGLKRYDPATGKLLEYGEKFNYANTVSSIIEKKQPDGSYLLWLDGNLLAFDEKKETYFNFQQPLAEKDFPAVRPVHQSTDGWIWLASDKGFYIYNPERQLFTHRFYKEGLTSQSVCFYNYKDELLVGAAGKYFLQLQDKNGNVLKDYGASLKTPEAVLYITKDSADDFWLGTSGGILHINLATGYKKWYLHKDGDSTTLPGNFITGVYIDSKKNIWAFPWRQGIWQLDKATGKCKKMLDGFSMDVGDIKKLLIGFAAEDKNGNIWMSDFDEGIILYNATTKQFTKPFEKQFGGRYTTAEIFTKGNYMYTQLGDGLLKWNTDSMTAERFYLPAEMNKGISAMYPDKNGNWWLGAKNGLIVFNEAEKTFKRFTTSDGLIKNDIDGSLFYNNDSSMIIGTAGYISAFDPQQLVKTSFNEKRILLSDFLVNNKAVDWDSSKTIQLGNYENNIIIRWALPDYSNPLHNQYYVKLNGIDEDWRYIGNTGEIQYINLAPGKYTVQLKASSANGAPSQNIITLRFIIHPAFWKTWWFITLCILAFIILFFKVVRYISQRNLKEKLLKLEKEQAVEKERNRISRDMHDDLGSGLTKIAIMSEVVKKQLHEPEKAKLQLENISASSRELVDNLQDIIWILNPKNDTLENFSSYIREYGLKFFEPFSIELKFDYPEQFSVKKLSEETRRNIFLTVKETFNNIAKHAWCNNVTITMQEAASTVLISIADNGKGFDTDNTRLFGNGLINMKNRVEQVGGKYTIQSEPGKGTVTQIIIHG